MVKVEVEYCGYCNFERQCNELEEFLQKFAPGTEVTCHKGRQGAFEVKINEELVYSKIQAVAFPDYSSIAENVHKAIEGKPLGKVKEQPIDSCTIM